MLQTLLLEEERDRHQNVDSHEGDAHEPMAGGVGRHKIDVQNAEDQRYHAEHVEVERHVVAGGPSDKHHDRNHTQRNLQRAPDRNAKRQLHLVLGRHDDCADVLARIPRERQHDDAEEGLAEAGARAELEDAARERLGVHRHQHRQQQQDRQGRPPRQQRLLQRRQLAAGVAKRVADVIAAAAVADLLVAVAAAAAAAVVVVQVSVSVQLKVQVAKVAS
mmetsp:Transcript_3881/g.11051  ORF Transcript_3881/g.11051 Transcript_3881/m.11051 type:complete len:219 (+) Transcript_3881:2002-2658(+)